MPREVEEFASFGKVRLEALTDGIFAIAMTVLVLTIKPPDFPDSATNEQILQQLDKIFPDFVAFVASFVTLGMYWLTHHIAFRYLVRTDRVILWLNIYFLLLVSVVPFTTDMYSGDVDNGIVNTIFGANLILLGLLNYAMWAYAWGRGYIDRDIGPHLKSFASRRILTPPILATLAMVESMIQPRWAELMYFLKVPIYMVTVRRVDLQWLKKDGNTAEPPSST